MAITAQLIGLEADRQGTLTFFRLISGGERLDRLKEKVERAEGERGQSRTG